MKKLFLVLALLIIGSFASQGAFASCNSDTDSFDTNGWCIDHYGQLTPKAMTVTTQQLSSQGGSQVPVIVVNNGSVSAITYSVLAQQSGTIFADMGGQEASTADTMAGTGTKYTLPAATPGLIYTFTTGSQETITVDTLNSSDTIEYSPNGTGLAKGYSIKNPGQAGDTVTLACAIANRWFVTSMHGSGSLSSTIDTLWINNTTN